MQNTSVNLASTTSTATTFQVITDMRNLYYEKVLTFVIEHEENASLDQIEAVARRVFQRAVQHLCWGRYSWKGWLGEPDIKPDTLDLKDKYNTLLWAHSDTSKSEWHHVFGEFYLVGGSYTKGLELLAIQEEGEKELCQQEGKKYKPLPEPKHTIVHNLDNDKGRLCSGPCQKKLESSLYPVDPV